IWRARGIHLATKPLQPTGHILWLIKSLVKLQEGFKGFRRECERLPRPGKGPAFLRVRRTRKWLISNDFSYTSLSPSLYAPLSLLRQTAKAVTLLQEFHMVKLAAGPKKPDYHVRVVDRVFAILEELADGSAKFGDVALAERLGLHKS